MARLRAASRALALVNGVEATLDAVLAQVLHQDDVIGGAIARPRPDGTIEILASTFGEVGRSYDGTAVTESTPLNDAMRQGVPVWLPDVPTIRAIYPHMEHGPDSSAWVALPLQVAGRTIGALGIAFRSQQPFDQLQQQYLLTLADLCAVVIDRQVLERRGAEHQFRALVDSNAIGVVSGHDGWIFEANAAFLDMLGLERADLAEGVDCPPLAFSGRRGNKRAQTLGPIDFTFSHRDGHAVPTRIVGTVLGTDDARFIAIVDDLSTERAAAAAARAGEARYRSLAEATNTIVWTADASGHFAGHNASWNDFTGQHDAESAGFGWMAALHPDDRAAVVEGVESARRDQKAWSGRIRLYHGPTGEYRQTVIRTVPLVGDDGIFEWIGTVTDVHDRAVTQAELRATTARLATLMQNAPVGFAFIDRDLRFQLVNDKLAEINGVPAADHLGRKVSEVVPDLADENEPMFRKVLAGESILETEVTGATPASPQDRRDWLVNYYPVRDDAGEILGIGATVVDMTERNRLLAAERSARTDAERSAAYAAALSATTAAIANAIDDDTIAREVGERLMSTLQADAGLVSRSDERGHSEALLFVAGYSDDDIDVIMHDPEPDAWSPATAVAHHEPIFYESPDEYLAGFPGRASFVEQVGAKSWAVVPLVAADHVLGFLVLMFRSPHPFATDERRFLATVGDVAAQAMLRARARAAEATARRATAQLTGAIAAERTRLAAVLHRMPAGLVVVDALNGRPRIALSNERAVDILGSPPPDGDAESWVELRTLEGIPIARTDTPLYRALQGEEVAEPEDATVVRTDGSVVPVRMSAVPIRDAEQRVASAIFVIEDITEHARRERDARLLAEVSDLLRTSDDVHRMLERIVRIAVPDFADACGLYVLEGEGLHLLTAAHRDPAHTDDMRRHLAPPITALSSGAPAAVAVREGRAILVAPVPESFVDSYLHPAQSAWVNEVLDPTAFLVVPLRAAERVTGALIFCQTASTQRTFTSPDIDVATELATRCALLLEQVVAHNETAQAHDRADRLQRFATAMARAASIDAVVSAIATEGADAIRARTLNVARRVEREGTFLDVETGTLHRDAPVMWRAVDERVVSPLADALKSGRPVYCGDVDAYDARYPDTDSAAFDGSTHAVAALPLYGSEGYILGAISCVFAEEHLFDDAERAMLETIADVAAQSLDRAQLYERERDVARALQLALLPSALPELDDIDIEARYIAGGAGVSVGGDWYDVWNFPDGRVGLLIGDAAGRGVEAASLMGKVRHAAAAFALDVQSPATVLARVNDYLHTIATRRSMLTCCYIVVDHDRGTLHYASAGHPPCIVVEDDGEPRFLEGGRGVPLGVIPGAVFSEAQFQLTGPTTVVLYTDGLVERRGETIDAGLARLVDAVRGYDTDVELLCRRLTGTLLDDTCDDDVAILAARLTVVPTNSSRLEMDFPADARRLHELRARVDRWLTEAGVQSDVIPDVVVALNEAASNSMLHAYSTTGEPGSVHISVAVEPDSVTATVTDEGRWREIAPDHDGRGMLLMRSLMNDVTVERDDHGTRVELCRTLGH